ncbi:hypothetical protein LEM9268_01987 [Leuconostoc mesenteroides]|nr:hypothetical protein C7M43_01610 [Leuconostoc mesenteroides]QHM58987.1 hypothetical protein C7M45_01730 [Leuconostoc mesenteroides]TDV92249.1 hypothetical protein C7818_10661 [Leuconostoc mesenteroides]SPE15357.1 hypothetical protein LEM9268_01987 [Leuconostoc mesenteroides]SPE70794.1 hypothetical protein LEM9217_01975 [Leuconostoc mesenteroides]
MGEQVCKFIPGVPDIAQSFVKKQNLKRII